MIIQLEKLKNESHLHDIDTLINMAYTIGLNTGAKNGAARNFKNDIELKHKLSDAIKQADRNHTNYINLRAVIYRAKSVEQIRTYLTNKKKESRLQNIL